MAAASSIRPERIHLFFLLNVALMVGVTKFGSVDFIVICRSG